MTTVYIADDETDLLEALAEVLADSGYDVWTTTNGADLLRQVDKRAPDLILLDINMPGLSGWEVQEFLQERTWAEHIPVIAVTAQGGAGVEESARRTLGFADFVRKPFRLADLLARIEKAVAAPARH